MGKLAAEIDRLLKELAALQAARKWSQRELAAKLGLTQPMVHYALHGKHLSLNVLTKIEKLVDRERGKP